MSTISNAHRPGGMQWPSASRPWCSECHTDEHLIIESIEALHPPQEDLVDVSYTCVECDYFYAHPANVHEVAAVLNRHGQVMGVLQFGPDPVGEQADVDRGRPQLGAGRARELQQAVDHARHLGGGAADAAASAPPPFATARAPRQPPPDWCPRSS